MKRICSGAGNCLTLIVLFHVLFKDRHVSSRLLSFSRVWRPQMERWLRCLDCHLLIKLKFTKKQTITGRSSLKEASVLQVESCEQTDSVILQIRKIEIYPRTPSDRDWFTQRIKHPNTNWVVLCVHCSKDCADLFIGETKQRLHKRMAQHRRATSSGQTQQCTNISRRRDTLLRTVMSTFWQRRQIV